MYTLSAFKNLIWKNTIPCLLFLILTCKVNYSQGQQNVQFNQYIFNSMTINPAYTGYKEVWFGQVGMRTQWTGVEGAPKTGTIAVDGVIDPNLKRHAVGLEITADGIGAQSAMRAYANYALRLQLDDYDNSRLAFGLAFGVTQYGLDGNKLIYVDEADPIIPLGKISTWKPDLRLGAYFSNNKWYAGISVQDLIAGNDGNEDFQFNQNSLESIYRNVHGYFIAGALFDLEPGLQFKPSLLVKDDLKGPTLLDINGMFIFNDSFWAGASYRTRSRIFNRDYSGYSTNKLSSFNSLTGIVQFYATPKFRIAYSYEQMLKKISGLQNNAHEITLGITFGNAKIGANLPKRLF